MNSQSMFVRGRGRGNRSQQTTQTAQPPNPWSQPRGRATNQNGPNPRKPGAVNSNAADRSHPSNATTDRLQKGQQNVADLFAKARSEHLQSAQRLLVDDNEISDESSEDEDIGNVVLDGVFKSYASTYENGNKGDIECAQEKLLHSFRSGTSACLVCIESIKKEDAIWSCKGCYCMFHIPCIQKWVKEGVYHKQYTSGDLHTNQPSDKLPWHCPKCRHEYSQKECPIHYYCFCGKQRDPKFDPWNVPHSCGNVCGCKLVPSCGHTCLLLCHPGACPPCPVMVKSKCHCEASAPRMVRCSARNWACGKQCGKMLSCGHHRCQDKCHMGECQPCTKKSLQSCLCGREKTQRPCDSVSWQCERVCNKALTCGNHVCEKTCHEGPCGDCPRSGLRKCPCGKTDFSMPCTEDVPNCGDTCGKKLSCGEHKCTQRCHTGSCGQCIEVAMKKCRCGQKLRQISCTKEFLCEKKCNSMRDCGVHKCNRKCCEGNCPSCEQICGKMLRCRNHKCSSRCHKGPCYPCPLTVDIGCHCGKTKLTVPCGKERSVKPPRCNLPCLAPPNCHHPARQKHRCHFGDCPPCRAVCDLKLKGCQHTCPVKCHDAVLVRIEDKSAKIGPWETRPVRSEIVCQPCPPCQVPIPIQCYGKHQTSDIPCHRVKQHSCGCKCGRQLACGNHTCDLECHTVTGTDDPKKAGHECVQCERGCEAPRPPGCSHPCLKGCHAAPCAPCTSRIRMRCHCQRMVKYIECHAWTQASDSDKQALKICGEQCTKELPCGHPCGELCHPGPCPNIGNCGRKVILKCRCKRISKEILCKEKDAVNKPECDANCQAVKKPKDNADEKRVEEEKKKAEMEMEEFERMMKGRRKKGRKHHEEVAVQSKWQQYKMVILAGIVGILAMAAVIYFQVM